MLGFTSEILGFTSEILGFTSKLFYVVYHNRISKSHMIFDDPGLSKSFNNSATSLGVFQVRNSTVATVLLQIY